MEFQKYLIPIIFLIFTLVFYVRRGHFSIDPSSLMISTWILLLALHWGVASTQFVPLYPSTLLANILSIWVQ